MTAYDLEYVEVSGRRIHYRLVRPELGSVPLLFLHEGLGSVELWRGFPDDLAERSGHPGLAYSRMGNGWSDALASPRQPDYMHEEALDVLPQITKQLLETPPIIIGHSDGASIAIIYAGAGHPVQSLVLIAPHVFVEDESVSAITAISERFAESDMSDRMDKYHRDSKMTFRGWADIWLSPAFRDWNIEEYLAGVHCPALLIQGADDEYGTIEQIEAIEAGSVAPTQRLIVPGAGHSPHLSHPEPVTGAVVDFVERTG